MFSSIANYAAKAYGMAFIKKQQTDTKDKILLEMITALDIAYAITIVKNHDKVWERYHFKETLQQEELLRYDNYNTLEEEEDEVKYSQRISRFSGSVTVKKTFGSAMRNKNGMTFFIILSKYGRMHMTTKIHGSG